MSQLVLDTMHYCKALKASVLSNRGSCLMVKQRLNHLSPKPLRYLNWRDCVQQFLQNRQSDILTHFTQQLARCAEVRKWAGFKHHEYLPGKAVRKMCTVIPIFNPLSRLTSLYDGRLLPCLWMIGRHIVQSSLFQAYSHLNLPPHCLKVDYHYHVHQWAVRHISHHTTSLESFLVWKSDGFMIQGLFWTQDRRIVGSSFSVHLSTLFYTNTPSAL